MSGASTKKKASQRVAQALVMAVVFGLMLGVSKVAPASKGASGVILGVGFLLLAGMLASDLLEVVGLPHLTGYLFAGAIAGPQLLNLVDHDAVQRLEPVNTLALSLIALAGGTELRIDLLKRVLRSLVWATAVQCVFGISVVGVAFVAISRFVPFTAGMSLSALVGVALLWAVLGVCRSPSATLGIFSQVRPDGPVSRFSLAFVMTSDVVVAMLLTAAIAVARPLIEPAAGFSLKDFSDLGHEIVGSISLGTTLGLALAAYLWLVGGQLLAVLVALGFGLTEGLHYLRFDPLLAFMVAGFVVANFSEQGEKLLSAIAETGSVVYVVFFATAGAHIDLALVRRLWPVAFFLVGVRIAGIFVAHRFASRLSGDDPVVRRWGWSSLVSQAGLTLGLSVVIERAFPSFGSGFRSLIIANVALNETIGPILFKFALDRTGESGQGTLEKTFHESIPPPPVAPKREPA
ncbi:MAG TPA: cation:proton antiporter [Polyangiaceae bacterium]|jgi:Kef-type K+ transport system membrane component KefB|nr:cation:proton antiporter [Polyangiaceae bacterium]